MRRSVLPTVAMLSVMVLLFGSCSGSDTPANFAEITRFPDKEGVVTSIDYQFVSLDGGTRYRISPEVQSFTSRQHKVTALLSWKTGWYVHLGLDEVDDEEEVSWIAGIGLVPGSGEVLYPGVFERIDRGRIIFKEGTALTLGRDVKVSAAKGAEVLATLDSKNHLVTSVREQR